MTKKTYNKLVRDKIPEIIRGAGGEPKVRILNDKEYLRSLIAKLKEEADELAEDTSVEELADISEVVLALQEAMKISAKELEKVRVQKASKRGAFKDMIFLESVEE